MKKDLSNDCLEQKWKIHLYLKVCKTLAEGEDSARNLRICRPQLQHLSILGKVSSLTEQDLSMASACFTHLSSAEIHFLDISGLGEIFVAGSLSSLLLEQIDGKSLGSLDGSLAGILSGYGLSNKKTTYYLEHLRKGNLIVIGWEYDTSLKSRNPFISAGIAK